MKHKIVSHKKETLYDPNRTDYATYAENDAEAAIKIQELQKKGHAITAWTSNQTIEQEQKKGKKS